MNYTVIPGLAARVNDLVADAPATEPIQGRTLFTDDHVKMPVFPLKAGPTFDEHAASHPAMLHFLQGEGE